jgi:hypothetical protein
MAHWRLELDGGIGEAWTDVHGNLTRIRMPDERGNLVELVPGRGRARGFGALRTIADLERIGVVALRDQES